MQPQNYVALPNFSSPPPLKTLFANTHLWLAKYNRRKCFHKNALSSLEAGKFHKYSLYVHEA